jgi:hypothetical protein
MSLSEKMQKGLIATLIFVYYLMNSVIMYQTLVLFFPTSLSIVTVSAILVGSTYIFAKPYFLGDIDQLRSKVKKVFMKLRTDDSVKLSDIINELSQTIRYTFTGQQINGLTDKEKKQLLNVLEGFVDPSVSIQLSESVLNKFIEEVGRKNLQTTDLTPAKTFGWWGYFIGAMNVLMANSIIAIVTGEAGINMMGWTTAPTLIIVAIYLSCIIAGGCASWGTTKAKTEMVFQKFGHWLANPNMSDAMDIRFIGVVLSSFLCTCGSSMVAYATVFEIVKMSIFINMMPALITANPAILASLSAALTFICAFSLFYEFISDCTSSPASQSDQSLIDQLMAITFAMIVGLGQTALLYHFCIGFQLPPFIIGVVLSGTFCTNFFMTLSVFVKEPELEIVLLTSDSSNSSTGRNLHSAGSISTSDLNFKDDQGQNLLDDAHLRQKDSSVKKT